MTTDTTDYYKLILTYDVNPELLQEYYQFVMGSYLPSMQGMEMEMIEAWSATYGDVPNRQIGFVARDKETVINLIDTDEWLALNEQLNEFVSEFDYKVVPFRKGFQM